MKYVIEDVSSLDRSEDDESECEKESEINSVFEVSTSASNKCDIQRRRVLDLKKNK